MPKEITKTYMIYTFAELSAKAKEAARDWYREGDSLEYQQSDENVDECILANEYTFDEQGKRTD
jgi:hypothetical protein